jgi:serine/threonine protein kinase
MTDTLPTKETGVLLCRQRAFEVLFDLLSRGVSWLGFRDHALQLHSSSKAFENVYRIGEKIGEGSFGKVYACEDLGYFPAKGPLCVKLVPLRDANHTHRIAKCSDEEKEQLLSSLLALRHPGLVLLHRYFVTEKRVYVVMDRCCGLPLQDYVSQASANGQPAGALPAPEVNALAKQILSALAALHAATLMHRDVKLDNFRFYDESSGVLQLLDFGFAKKTSGKPANHTVTGTLLYAAPEVFEGSYCQSCDVWSAGIVLFQLLVGHLPFETSDVMILRSMHRDPVLLGNCLFRGKSSEVVPMAGQKFIRSLLTVDPAKRPSASAAMELAWLKPRLGSGEGSGSNLTSLLRKASQSFENLQRSMIDPMKRSKVKWNLADMAGNDEEDDGAMPKSTSLLSKSLNQ